MRRPPASKCRVKLSLSTLHMNNLALKLAFGVLLGSVIAYAQTSPPPATSPMVSSNNTDSETEGSIKPEKSTVKDTNDTEEDIVADPASLLPDMPPVGRAKATLIGGTIEKLDRVRDQITVSVFGGGKMKVLFDPRTHIYLRAAEGKSVEGKSSDLHEGERIYLDTMLDGSTVFARSIRVKTTAAVGESQGVVTSYRADRGELTMRDSLSPSPVRIRIGSSTQIKQGGRMVSASTLGPGSLIAVTFDSNRKSGDLAREISILALPGTHYTFAGQITFLDLSAGLLVLKSSTDNKTYEVHLDSGIVPDENLHPGAVVTVVTNFDGSRYVARNVTIETQGK